MSNIYLYGLINSPAPININASGVVNIKPYILPFKDIGIIVGTYIDENIDISLENLSKHDEVICELSEIHCILPITFGTIVKDEQAINTFISNNYEQIKMNFKSLLNKCEMGLKIIWDIEKAKKSLNVKEPVNINFSSDSRAKAYINKKFIEYSIENKLHEKAEFLKEELVKDLGSLVEVSKIKLLQSEKMVINGAFLIDMSQKEEFKSALETFKHLHKDLHFLLSGPWVPYNFVEMAPLTHPQ